ncbi:hypothetical protein PspLS_10938 [Pyricularia sp. CBS 133598]|nr:hypothetical protein PspLS_10938 [Pyricularia sp. CBS 133598]
MPVPGLSTYCWGATTNWAIRKSSCPLSAFGTSGSMPTANISWIAQKRDMGRANGQPEVFFIGVIKLAMVVSHTDERYETLWEEQNQVRRAQSCRTFATYVFEYESQGERIWL